MMKLETAHIEEVRGIRKLDIDFQKGTFAISGPNGSGKSGVIDAIEFGLTVAEHGPHVDKTKFPDAAFVELRVFIPALKKSATITRKVSDPKKPKIVPADPDVQAALAEIADQRSGRCALPSTPPRTSCRRRKKRPRRWCRPTAIPCCGISRFQR